MDTHEVGEIERSADCEPCLAEVGGAELVDGEELESFEAGECAHLLV